MASSLNTFECLKYMNIATVLSSFCLIFVCYYIWPAVNSRLSYLPGPPCYPIIGSLLGPFRKGFGYAELEALRKYGKVFQTYEGRSAAIVVADVDMLKEILVRRFDNFTDRKLVFQGGGKIEQSLFHAKGNRWRRLRNLLTPAFTSSKLKMMEPDISQCINRFLRNLSEVRGHSDGFEAKSLTGAFAMDVIARSAFGLELNSKRDVTDPFLDNASKFFPSIGSAKLFIPMMFPFILKFMKFLGVTSVNTRVYEYFEHFLTKVVGERRKTKQEYQDLLQHMLNAYKEKLDEESLADISDQIAISEIERQKGLTSTDLLVQCIIFLVAGYDTTASTLAFLMHSLAENPEVQEKLYQEIKEIEHTHEGISLENISKMSYLEQCVQETLRMYPPVARVTREASRDIRIKGIDIPEGATVVIPIYALHHDPDVWPDPLTFDPQRFSPAAMADRSPFSHLPFGMGPRQCIGRRLALMEIKMATAKLISRYRLLSTEKPLRLEMHIFARANGGIWVRAAPRNVQTAAQ